MYINKAPPPPATHKHGEQQSVNLPSLLPLNWKLVRSKYFTVHLWATVSEYILVNGANIGHKR